MLTPPQLRDGCPPGTILVVHGEQSSRMHLQTLLAAGGHSVILAEAGEEALRLLEATATDLVFLDTELRDPDGYEICRRIRQRRPVLPVVLLTALDAGGAAKQRGAEVGADDFLTLPVDAVVLALRARNLLRLKLFFDNQQHWEARSQGAPEQLLEVDRLATLGTLAAGVGHELSNDVGVLKATAQFMRRDRERGAEPSAADIDNIGRVAERLAGRAHQLLDLGRPKPDAEQPVDLREVIEATLEMLRLVGKTKYQQVELSLTSEPAYVRLRRSRLEQVIINLVGNAVDALEATPGLAAAIRVGLEPSPRAGWVRFSVSDNGAGIPPENRERIFEPYFTTKAPGEGTGLGLTVVRHIVSRGGGQITVRDLPGGGALFELELPLTSRAI